MRKHTLIEVQQEFIDKNLTPLFDEYKDGHQKLLAQTQEGYLIVINLANLKWGKIPQIVNIYNPYAIYNINLWVELNNRPFKLLDNQNYKGTYEKLKWKCNKCNDIFEASWDIIHRGHGCGVCHGRQVGLSNCLVSKRPDLIKEWHLTKNGNLTPYDVTYGSKKYVWWKCCECGYEWKTSIDSRTHMNSNCPQCAQSKGEKRIREYFNSNNIKYVFQKEFNGLLGTGEKNLSYDFYLSQYNLLIEYDGEFHFEPIRKYKNEPIKYAEARLKKQQEHDRRKDEYAKNNNIKLLRIPYWDFDNIEEILKREFL